MTQRSESMTRMAWRGQGLLASRREASGHSRDFQVGSLAGGVGDGVVRIPSSHNVTNEVVKIIICYSY